MTHARRRLALGFVVLLVLASPAFADYVVLTGMDEGDAYHAAAVKLAKHHRTKHILRFDPEHPDRIADRLREIAPTHVAIVLRPEQIHVNSVRRFLKMATTIDADPFVDFEYGFITGATAKEAVRFVTTSSGRPRRNRWAGWRGLPWAAAGPAWRGRGSLSRGA